MHLKQNTKHDVVYLTHELKELVVRQVLESKIALRNVVHVVAGTTPYVKTVQRRE